MGIKHADFQSVGGGMQLYPLKVGRACLLLLLASFVTFSEYTASTSFCTHTVGQTGSWTVTQTHEKRAHETLKGGPVSP